MFKKISTPAVSAAVLVAAAAAALSPAAASAVSAPLSSARIVMHFDLAKGQTPENIALAPGGAAYVTFAEGRQIAEVSPKGAIRILATLPKPADGGVHTPVLGFPLTVGIVRAHDGTLYFLYATGTSPLIDRTRPMTVAPDVFAAMRDGDVFGKVVFTRLWPLTS